MFIDNTIRGWRNLAIVTLLITIAFPFLLLDNPPMGAIIALEAMQMVAGVIAIYLLTTQVKLDEG